MSDGSTEVTSTITVDVLSNNHNPVISGDLQGYVMEDEVVGTIVNKSYTVTDGDTPAGDGLTFEISGEISLV